MGIATDTLKISMLPHAEALAYFESIKDQYPLDQHEMLLSGMDLYKPTEGKEIQIAQSDYKRPPSAIAMFQAAVYMAGATQALIAQYRGTTRQTVQEHLKKIFGPADVRLKRMNNPWNFEMIEIADAVYKADLKADPTVYNDLMPVEIGRQLYNAALRRYAKENTDRATDSIVNKAQAIPVASASDIVLAAKYVSKRELTEAEKQHAATLDIAPATTPEAESDTTPRPAVSPEERSAMDDLFK